MFPYMVFIGLMAIAMGVLNSLKHFTAPALAPVFFNLAIIACVFIIAPALSQPVYALAVGVLIGGALQFLLQLPYLRKFRMLPTVSFRFRDPGIKRIFLLMGPAAFGVGVYQLNVIVTLWFASRLAEGSVSYLYYAGRLMELPMGVFGVAITTAMLPSLSESVTREDWDGFRRSLSFVLRALNFLMIPATLGLFILSYPIVDVLFSRGEFGGEAAEATSFALYFYSLGLVPVSISRVLSSVFYSLKDTVTPVFVALGSFAFNIIMCLVLVGPLKHGGLALATTLSGLMNMLALYIILRYRFGSFGGRMILSSGIKSAAASVVMGAAIYLLLINASYENMSDVIRPVFVAACIISGVVVYMAASRVLNVGELSILKDFLQRRKGG
jgi:putative peptidoglycan lipid II flippase